MPYIEFAKKRFKSHLVYRFDYIIGIVDTCVKILIFMSIYKVLYGDRNEVLGITFTMVMTNFVISLGLSSAFRIDDFFVYRKVRDGSIGNELLRPVNFKGRMLAETIGDVIFGIIFNFLPVLIIAIISIGIEKPIGLLQFVLFLISIILGFLVLWCISFIVQMLSFWIMHVWSVSTIKNVFINVLSGSLFPLWFMPEKFSFIIKYTPFSSIYFTPVQLYLGQIQSQEIAFVFIKQLCWILLLYAIGDIMWRLGRKKVVVQGG